MLYDLSQPLQAENFKLRANKLFSSQAIVELSERTSRSLSQNAYLHVIIAYFAAVSGNTAEWVKEQYFKRAANQELFLRERNDPILGERTRYLRSTSELDKEETATAIERFRNWAAQVAGIYLPAPEEREMVAQARVEAERARQYL